MTERRHRLDPVRAARAVVLATWAGFFSWLWIGGGGTRYLGPRTLWVLPFGAVTLALAALAHGATIRSERPRRPSFGEVAGMAVLLLPVLAVVMVPSPSLGALAASKKATSQGTIALGSLAAPAPEPGRAISFIDFHYADESEQYAQGAGMATGTSVTLLGFVTHGEGVPPGGFDLTRFYISCCAADALPYSAPVRPPRGYSARDDTWLQVSGTIVDEGGHYLVVARDISPASEPKDPYLY